MSKSLRAKPALLSKKENGLSLSGSAFVELLKAVLDKGTPFRFRAEGFSMHPFIRNGDLVTLSPLFNTIPRLGDVVAFVLPGTDRLMIHRIIGAKGRFFLIKGDNLHGPDGLIPKTNILGRVTRVERNGKEIFFGIGPERILIALLTRRRAVSSSLLPVLRLVRPIIKRWLK